MAQINKPNLYFNTKLYTGTGATQSITGVGFQPDWTWIKNRSITANHHVFDVVRGATKYIITNSTNAEATDAQQLQSFDSDGFTVGTNGNVNGSGNNIVAWNWLADNTSGSSNTDGSITSTVSANTTSGFSIVTYSGTGSNATVGHGLGVTPDMVIVKDRTNNVGSTNWNVYHSANTSAPETEIITLNGTGATSDSNIYWNDTAPTSSVFSLGTAGQVNYSSDDYVAYCFTSIKGFSKFGSYTGNGNADGTFTYLGFKPAFVIIKQTNAAGENWFICDNKREGYNAENNRLIPNLSTAEQSDSPIDILSNGFKARETGAKVNASGSTYIYMAFAENPLVGTNNIPATAR